MAILLAGILPVWAADAPHGMHTPATIKWSDPPPFIPKGSKQAVLYGDPAKEGLGILQARLPANYRIPAHSHPMDEIVSVLSGTLHVGMGDKLEPGARRRSPSAASSSCRPTRTTSC
jgi:quercetin dioxygenase-like cupin family protein